LIQACSACVAALATESVEPAAAVLDDAPDDTVPDDAVPAAAAVVLDDELLLQPAMTASPAAAATQAMRHRVLDLRLLGAGVFIPPPSRGLAVVPLDGIVSVLRNLQAYPACAQVSARYRIKPFYLGFCAPDAAWRV
jgi:hypothetical protein